MTEQKATIKTRIPAPTLRLLFLAILLSVSGCTEADPITQYQVPKEQSPVPQEKPTNALPVAQTSQQTAWFFKITGPHARIDALEVTVRTLLESVTFDEAGRPHWQTPEGWTKGPAKDLRFATLIPPGEPEVEFTITSLPVKTSDLGSYLLSNVNRWRAQLGLQPHDGEKWFEVAAKADELSIVRSAAGRVFLVHLNGNTEQFGETRLLAAMILFGDPPDDATAKPETTAADTEIKSKAPENWTPTAPAQFQIAAWTVQQDRQKITISLARARGSLVENLNRWRKQIGLTDLDGEELKTVVVHQQISGHDALVVEFIGDTETIDGTIILDGDQFLFVKLKGDNELAKREQEHWQEFLKSLQF